MPYYIKIIIRNFLKNKLSLLINILGLSVGLASCIILALWVSKEYSYNRFLPEQKPVFQIITNFEINNTIQSARATSYPIIQAIETEIPEVERIAYVQGWDEEYVISSDDKELTPSGRLVSENFFAVVDRPFLYGDKQDALQEPLSIAISASLAYKFFGPEWKKKVTGNSLILNGWKEVDIRGVFEDFPENSTIKIDYMLPLRISGEENIGNINYEAYVTTHPEVEMLALEKKINSLISDKTNYEIMLQPFEDVYLHSNFYNGKIDGGRIEYVRIFIVTAVFILLMACINYINLYIARVLDKVKEIGVKKVLGAHRYSLIKELLLEACLVATIAILLALVLVSVLTPFINYLSNSYLDLPFNTSNFWVGIVFLLIITSLIAGIYPAFLITSFNPITALQGKFNVKVGKGIGVRKILFAFQFFVSITLIFFTYGVANQLGLLKEKNLGYEKKNVICKKIAYDEIAKWPVIKEKITSQTFFSSVTLSSTDLLSGSPLTGDVHWPNKVAGDSSMFGIVFSDEDFFNTFNVPILAGKLPSSESRGSNNVVVLSQKAAEKMGGIDYILNTSIEVWGEDVTVVGIVEDFHITSLYDPIQPLIIAALPTESSYLMAKVQDGKHREALDYLENLHNEHTPNQLFSYFWLEDSIERLYHNESVTEKVATAFSLLSILIASMGLFGLANFTIKSRVKELSIRKVLGANFSNIILLLFRDFAILICIAIALAIPLSYILLSNWLNKFAYRVEITLFFFLFPTVLMIGISLVTIIYHSVKVSLLRPSVFLSDN